MDTKSIIGHVFKHNSATTTDKYIGNKTKADIQDGLIRAVILDKSGIYAQIYDQGYFHKDNFENIKEQYSDPTHWQVVVIE